MGALRAEFSKLKRGSAWAVVILLPIAMVLSGAANTLASGEPLPDGWRTLWLRSVVFYGLFALPLGIAIIASLVWRPEHRGGNWNALMSSPTSSLRILVAKVTAVAVLAGAMQLVLLVALSTLGSLAFGLPGLLPREYLGISGLIVLSCLPAAALQSALSMLMRSFAGPIAIAFLGAGLSVVAMLAGVGAAIVSPYALVARATQLGTGTFADSGSIGGGDLVSIALAAVALTAALLAAAANIVDRLDART